MILLYENVQLCYSSLEKIVLGLIKKEQSLVGCALFRCLLKIWRPQLVCIKRSELLFIHIHTNEEQDEIHIWSIS